MEKKQSFSELIKKNIYLELRKGIVNLFPFIFFGLSSYFQMFLKIDRNPILLP